MDSHMIVDILDSLGNIIGELELPDGTDPSVIAEKLAIYTYKNPTPTVKDIVSNAITNAATFGYELTVQFATENVIAGITPAGKTQAVADYVLNLNYYLKTGSLYAAF